jgi:argininosuccinate lyase
MGLTEKALEEAKDPAKNVERRKILGGPAKAAVAKKLKAEKARLDADGKAMAGLRKKLDRAGEELSKAVAGMTGEP